MSEDELLAQVLAECRARGFIAYHCYDSRKTEGRGFPDLVIAAPGGIVFAELKTMAGKLDRDQTIWRYRLQAVGQAHYVWRPCDLNDGTITDILDALLGAGY